MVLVAVDGSGRVASVDLIIEAEAERVSVFTCLSHVYRTYYVYARYSSVD